MNNTILLKNICKQYNGMWILKNVSADIFPQKITAFVGPNGAGKTTLFNIIAGELIPDEGKVFLNHVNITGKQPYEIAKMGVGRLFQDVRIFENISVIDNVSISFVRDRDLNILNMIKKIFKIKQSLIAFRDKAFTYLKLVGLEDVAFNLANELSFGQQKLLSFARLMAADFKVLLLDEPFAGVSHNKIEKILELLKYAVEKKGKTIALIEHNIELVSDISDYVYFMNEGKIEFFGTAEHVLTSSKVRDIFIGV